MIRNFQNNKKKKQNNFSIARSVCFIVISTVKTVHEERKQCFYRNMVLDRRLRHKVTTKCTYIT